MYISNICSTFFSWSPIKQEEASNLDIEAQSTKVTTTTDSNSDSASQKPMPKTMDAATEGIATAACCAKQAGDALVNAVDTGMNASGQKAEMHAHAISIPKDGAEIASAVASVTVGVAGALASINVATAYKKQIDRFETALNELAELKKIHGSAVEIDALEEFIQQELITAKFMQRIPGQSAAAASTLMVIGQFFAPLLSASIYLTTVNACLHVKNTLDRINQTTKRLSAMKEGGNTKNEEARRAQKEQLEAQLLKLRKDLFTPLLSEPPMTGEEATLHIKKTNERIEQTRALIKENEEQTKANEESSRIQTEHFETELSLLRKNLASWMLFAGGAASLGTMTVGMIEQFPSITQLALTIAGTVALPSALIGALKYNTPLYSNPYTPGVTKAVTVNIHSELQSAQRAHETAMQLQAEQVEEQKQRVLQPHVLNFTNENTVTAELVKAEQRRTLANDYHAKTFADMDAYSRWRFYMNDVACDGASLMTFGLVQDRVSNVKRQLKEWVTTKFNNKQEQRLEALRTLQKIETGRDDFPKENDASDSLLSLLNLLHGTDSVAGSGQVADGVGKLLARKILTVADGKVKIHTDYQDLFVFGTIANQNDILEDLQFLLYCPPCCSGGYQAATLLETLRDYYCSSASSPSIEEAKKIRFQKLIEESTDQYLAFALSYQGQEEIARYSRYLAAFQVVNRSKQKINETHC